MDRANSASWLRMDESSPWLHAVLANAVQVGSAEGLTEDEAIERALSAMEHALASVSATSALDLRATLARRAPTMLAQHSRADRRFRRDLRATWGHALDGLYEVYVVCEEIGSTFNEEFRAEVPEDEADRYAAMVELHARACLTVREVWALLSAGHPAAAAARWRTLHECYVVSVILGTADPAVATAYFEHRVVDDLKHLRGILKHRPELTEPWMPERVTELTAERDRLVGKYGKGFVGAYGWAASAVGKEDHVTFFDLEQHGELEAFRPYYQAASHRIHGSAVGLEISQHRSGGHVMLLTGQTDVGLDDPAIATVASICAATANLLIRSGRQIDGVMAPVVMRSIDLLMADVHRRFESAALDRTGALVADGSDDPRSASEALRARVKWSARLLRQGAGSAARRAASSASVGTERLRSVVRRQRRNPR